MSEPVNIPQRIVSTKLGWVNENIVSEEGLQRDKDERGTRAKQSAESIYSLNLHNKLETINITDEQLGHYLDILTFGLQLIQWTCKLL